MATSSVTSIASTTGTNPWASLSTKDTAASKATLDYNNFLKLLITQMKNQDPTQPMDATQQISQLATFSQVGQTIETNKNLKSMLQADALTKAGDLVGKTVKSADDKVVGVVKEIEVYSDGVVAITESGEKVLIQSGVAFSNGPFTATTTTSTEKTQSDQTTDESGSKS